MIWVYWVVFFFSSFVCLYVLKTPFFKTVQSSDQSLSIAETLINTNKIEKLRILVTITGAWGTYPWNSADRITYLRLQLERFRLTCEQGHLIHVFLISYSNWNFLTPDLQFLNELICFRNTSDFQVTVRLFDFENLPEGAFGTSGTIACKHREVYKELVNQYDIYMSQEDDVAVFPHHFSYFYKWMKQFYGTNFYPTFILFEILHGRSESHSKSTKLNISQIFVTWRLKKGYLYRENEHFFIVSDILWPMYMLTNNMLNSELSDKTWLEKCQNITGEYNPYFNSPSWFASKYRLVLPAADLLLSLIHHLPNKYVNLPHDNSQPFFNEISLEESAAMIRYLSQTLVGDKHHSIIIQT